MVPEVAVSVTPHPINTVFHIDLPDIFQSLDFCNLVVTNRGRHHLRQGELILNLQLLAGTVHCRHGLCLLLLSGTVRPWQALRDKPLVE